MKTNHFILLLVALFFITSCNTPKRRANKALELSKDGEYVMSPFDYSFKNKDMFTDDPYYELYKDGKNARAIYNKVWNCAESLVRIPNLIDSYKFISMEKSTMDIINVMGFRELTGDSTINTLDDGWVSYYKDMGGIIDNNRKLVTYTSEKDAEAATLKYIIEKDGTKYRYEIKLVKLDKKWKIYYAYPEIHL